MNIVVGIFIAFHGLVILFYAGQSSRLFELESGMTYPDGSWAFSGLLGNKATRLLGSAGFLLSAIGFVAGGIGIMALWSWWGAMVVISCLFSTVVYALLWDGKFHKLPAQGLYGILINIVILFAIGIGWLNF